VSISSFSRGDPLVQDRPEQLVLRLVVLVQHVQHQGEMLADDLGPGGVAGRDAFHLTGRQGELPAQAAVGSIVLMLRL
jgi:hypothetical protein